MKRIALLLVLMIVLSSADACSDQGSQGTPSAPSANLISADESALDHSDLYEFEWYSNYAWDTIVPWGSDEVSKYWGEKFNIYIDRTKPESNEAEALNLRITGNDLPDAIWMNRGADNIRLAQMGLLVDLDTLKPMMGNNWYDDNVAKMSQEMYKIDGKLYGVPNWTRSNPSGGNYCWMITTDIYEAAGSPELRTFEDLYNYAVAVRDNVKTTSDGFDVLPVLWEGTNNYATQLPRAIYRSYGGPYISEGNYFVPYDNKYQLTLRDPNYRAALLETNKWYREGLFPESTFTDTNDQINEKLAQARGGLIWYDQSLTDGDQWRQLVQENYPGNSIELVTAEENGVTYLWLPANGLPYEKIYGEHYGTLGWNVSSITTAAEKPERIFEYLSYMLTKQGSLELQYGPPGFMWNEVDAKGNPVLLKSPAEITPEENAKLGLWVWQQHGHSDNIDIMKFAVNDALPEESRSWVVSNQAHIFTPLMSPLTNEAEQMDEQIQPDTDLAVKRTLCAEYLQAAITNIIRAESESDANALIDDAIAFCDANGMPEIEAIYTAKWEANCATQGGSIYTR